MGKLKPDRKTGAGLAGGTPLAVVLVFLWNSLFPDNPLPGEVAAAVGTLAAFVVAWLTLPAAPPPEDADRTGRTALLVLMVGLGVLALSACSTTPQSPRQAYAAALALHSETLNLAVTARERGLLSADQVLRIEAVNVEASRYLDTAGRLIRSGAADAALAWVDRAVGLFEGLRATLRGAGMEVRAAPPALLVLWPPVAGPPRLALAVGS